MYMKSSTSHVYVVSVVRDFGLYNRLVRENPCLSGCELYADDNNQSNVAITRRYNAHLNVLNRKEGWIVFCHEDFEFLDSLKEKLENLERGAIYGIAGVDFNGVSQGLTLNSEKDGSGLTVTGRPFSSAKLVSTLDCMCVIVHSDLIRKTCLRFDENLLFDMYVEDFCATAHERFGVPSYVLPIRTQHYSWGCVGDRFNAAYKYVAEKFRGTSTTYYTTLSRRFGNGCFDLEPYARKTKYNFVFFVFLVFTDNGRWIISLLRYRLKLFSWRFVDPKKWKSANPMTIL